MDRISGSPSYAVTCGTLDLGSSPVSGLLGWELGWSRSRSYGVLQAISTASCVCYVPVIWFLGLVSMSWISIFILNVIIEYGDNAMILLVWAPWQDLNLQ